MTTANCQTCSAKHNCQSLKGSYNCQVTLDQYVTDYVIEDTPDTVEVD